jgi:hypothetical protein
MSQSGSRCDHRRRGPNLCLPTLEPFDRSTRAPATAPASAARITPVSAAGLETRRRPGPTEPPSGAHQLRLLIRNATVYQASAHYRNARIARGLSRTRRHRPARCVVRRGIPGLSSEPGACSGKALRARVVDVVLVSVVDLDRANPAVHDALAAGGDDVLIWPDLRMAALRSTVRLPAAALDGLQRPPREINRQRWAIIDGLARLMGQARGHGERIARNGNDELAAAAGGQAASYPVVDPADGRVTQGPPLPTRLGWMAAINLSLGTSAPGDFDPDDPVNIATQRVAESLPIVMAAGNAVGLWRGPAAFSKWAKAPWIIAVTALRGGRIADDSATGDPEDVLVRPTVAASDDRLTVYHADSGEVEAHRGTSIAAAVGTHQLARLTAFCLTVRSVVQMHGSRTQEGIPRIGVGVVDTGFDLAQLPVPTWPYGALPVIAVDHRAGAALARASSQTGIELDALPSTSAMRRFLVASAQDVEGQGPHQVGRRGLARLHIDLPRASDSR